MGSQHQAHGWDGARVLFLLFVSVVFFVKISVWCTLKPFGVVTLTVFVGLNLKTCILVWVALDVGQCRK